MVKASFKKESTDPNNREVPLAQILLGGPMRGVDELSMDMPDSKWQLHQPVMRVSFGGRARESDGGSEQEPVVDRSCLLRLDQPAYEQHWYHSFHGLCAAVTTPTRFTNQLLPLGSIDRVAVYGF